MAFLIGKIIGAIIGAAIGALIGALVVRFATNIVAKFIPPFSMAYKASFVGELATYLIGLLLGFIIGASGNQIGKVGYLLFVVIGFFVYAAILSPMIKHPETGPIGFGKACYVSLVQTITMIVIIGGVSLLVIAMIK